MNDDKLTPVVNQVHQHFYINVEIVLPKSLAEEAAADKLDELFEKVDSSVKKMGGDFRMQYERGECSASECFGPLHVRTSGPIH